MIYEVRLAGLEPASRYRGQILPITKILSDCDFSHVTWTMHSPSALPVRQGIIVSTALSAISTWIVEALICFGVGQLCYHRAFTEFNPF